MESNTAAQEIDIRPKFVILASKVNQEIWESLTPQQQELLENQATLRDLDTPEKCDRFFESRDFQKPSPRFGITPTKENGLNESYDPVIDSMKRLRMI